MPGYLLDTSVIAELVKPAPHPAVVAWVDAGDQTTYALSVLTLGEIQEGISKLGLSTRQTTLYRWLRADLVPRFAGRVLPVDEAVAMAWGELADDAQRHGAPLPVLDGLIAATARVHQLTVVTRNVRDFARCGVAVINPWDV